MKIHKQILIGIGMFLTLIIIFWGALILGAIIPNEYLYDNFVRSTESYKEQEPYVFHNGEKLNSIADNYADAILLNIAWNMGETASPLAASLDTRYYDGEELGESIGLYLTVTEKVAPNTDYTRYWHGTAGLVRALHLLTDVNGVRIIGFTAALLLILLTAVVLIKSKHTDIAVLLLISLAAVHIWNIRLSMEYQSVFTVTFLLCPLFLLLERKSDRFLPLLCVASGTAVSFFDFLTTETLTLLLPLILVISVRAKENRLTPLKKSLALLLECAICWGIAYAGAFLVKWTAASIVTGENEFSLALSSIGERIGGEVTAEQKPASLFSALSANLTVLTGGTMRIETGRVLLFLIAAALILFSAWYLFRAKETKRDASISLLIVGAPVFVRYLILNNHSYLHEFFTYRALAAPILATLLILWLNIELPNKKRVKRK